MHQVTVNRNINISAERAWEIVSDFGGIYRYHPLVVKSPITNDITSGVGAERVCHFADGNQVAERVTGHQEGLETTIEITDPGKFPLKSAKGRLSVAPLDGDRSRVGFEMQFEPKFGPLGWLMGKTVMTSQFKRILGDVLEGVETHARTGEVVGANQPAGA